MDSKQSYTNRLAREKSPYLLQHQHNPVDWFAWGDEAFNKARADKKIIFLSIGYSTCHWCHVMERESFEDPKLASFLNQHFVSIKVDREERPDVDKIYMTAVQAMGQGGGWPLNVFLTSDLKPFYGGTYWPPESKYGRPSFLQVLEHIVELWQERPGDITKTSLEFHEKLTEHTAVDGTDSRSLSPALLRDAARQFKDEYDSQYGGFGGAPKFPRPAQPSFILRQAVRHDDKNGIEMVLNTCEHMARGGMYDQLGGGFSRYSVDAMWLVPHFEKMLYDNAQLVQLYLDAWLVSGDRAKADVARDIIRYVLRDMTHQGGGFFSAEDADSEGKEGKFYCWTNEELQKLLTPNEFKLAVHYFGVTEKGNFVDHSDPHPLPNQNILYVAHPKLSDSEKPVLQSAKQKMFAARAGRVRPHLDDNVLASWNGLMLGAIARAAAVLDDPGFLTAAEKNAAFIRSKLWDEPSRTLFHRWRDGERDQVQLLDAYSNTLDGMLYLYEATLNPKHLEFARAVAESMIEKFYDAKNGGFWQSAGADDLILRIKDDYDGAEPSGNSMAVLALLRLAAITDNPAYKNPAEKTLKLFGGRLQRMPRAVPFLLQGLDFLLEEPRRAVIAGDFNLPETQALIQAAHAIYQPNRVILGTIGPVEDFAKTLPLHNGKPTIYVCTGSACQPPTIDPDQVKRLLK
ncbi:MAG: hypothetical protein JWM99_4428 [Verrucomicrobiales bacterium]|nr:hypothetical protein [Verrucomicrobiales bacterium]